MSSTKKDSVYSGSGSTAAPPAPPASAPADDDAPPAGAPALSPPAPASSPGSAAALPPSLDGAAPASAAPATPSLSGAPLKLSPEHAEYPKPNANMSQASETRIAPSMARNPRGDFGV